MHSLADRKTYVYRESTRAIPSLSILLMYCSRRTMLRFHCVVLSERSYNSSKDQGERASVEHRIAAGHLQDTVSLSNERWGETNVSSYSFRLTLDEERLRTQVSTGDTCFARGTYPNPDEYYLLMPCHLTEQILRNICEESCKDSAPSITTFMLPTRPWTTPKVCATVIRASSWVNRSNFCRTAYRLSHG